MTMLALDYETTRPAHTAWVHACRAVGYSLCDEDGRAAYYQGVPPPDTFTYHLVCHNAKFEITQTRKLGYDIPRFEDTMLAAYLLDYEQVGLKYLTKRLLNIEPVTYKDVTKGRDMGDIPPEDVASYGAGDAYHTMRLWQLLSGQLRTWGLEHVYWDIEKPLVPVLVDMEARGILVDRDAAESAVTHFENLERQVELEAHWAGVPWSVSLGSSAQLATWLEEAGAPCRLRTETSNQPSTTAVELAWIAAQDWRPDVIGSILNFKEKRKLKSFPQGFLADSDWDGLLHPSINQAAHQDVSDDEGARSPVTGRLSCSTPNVQQIPHHGRGKPEEYAGYADIIRDCLVARPGYTFVLGDIEQQEPRIAAYVINEKRMLEDFEAGIPIYAPMGEAIYGRSISKSADPVEWMTAKTFFLAILYGSEWDKLMEIDTRLTRDQAKAGYTRLTQRYRGLKPFTRAVQMEIEANGFARDHFGRVRWFPGVYASGRGRALRQAALREAVNFKIQGPGASVIKLAMARVHAACKGKDMHLLLTVHDALMLEVRDDLLDSAADVLYNMTEGLMPMRLPVEVQIGKSLGRMVRHVQAVPRSVGGIGSL